MALGARQPYLGSDSDSTVPGIVQERGKLTGGTVADILHTGLQVAHVGIDRFVRAIDRHVVVLIAVARIHHDSLVQVININMRADFLAGILGGSVGKGEKLHFLSGDELFYDMPSAEAEFPGVIHIGRIVMTQFGGSQKNVHRGDARITEYVVQPGFGYADFGFRLPEVQKTAGGTHGPESRRGNHVHFFGSLFQTLLFHIVYNLLGSQHDSLARSDFLINFGNCFQWESC